MDFETDGFRKADRQSWTSSTLDTRQAAAYLGISKPYLDKLRCYGGGPRFAKLGRRVVYRIPDSTFGSNNI